MVGRRLPIKIQETGTNLPAWTSRGSSPPPAHPVGADVDWPSVETALGVRLPGDYKELVARYGDGEFCALLHVLTEPDDMLPGGLLPWAGTSNGHVICWQTGGEPDTWPVVVAEQRYDTTATGFLHAWLSDGIPIFPAAFTATARWFDQPSERVHVTVRFSATDLPYAEQLRLVQKAMAPVTPRWRNPAPQEIFDATEANWRVTYETGNYQLRIAFPTAESAPAEAAVRRVAAAMSRDVIAAQTYDGTPVWG